MDELNKLLAVHQKYYLIHYSSNHLHVEMIQMFIIYLSIVQTQCITTFIYKNLFMNF